MSNNTGWDLDGKFFLLLNTFGHINCHKHVINT